MKLEEHEIFAWMGEDELGSGKIGLKQGRVPAGIIALVAMDYHRDKLERLRDQLQLQVDTYGKPMYLVRMKFEEVVMEIHPTGDA